MGILEDAIREHLELKRKHGADPTEVAKQEREALSPATREAAGGGEAVGLAEPEAAEAEFADAGARVFGLALPISEASSADKSR